MHLQSTDGELLADLFQELFSFLPVPKMLYGIVGIARKWTRRMTPPHPCVKAIVHEQIDQQWTDPTSFWSSAAPVFQGPVNGLTERCWTSFDVKDPLFDFPCECTDFMSSS